MAKYKSKLPVLPKRGYFKTGDKGDNVKLLQKALNWANQGRIVATLKADGIVGPKTISAVTFFQEIQRLTIDGEFGAKSLAKIKSMDLTGAGKAINFAVSVAKDNRFTYGAGERAHRSGCYFCQTNTGPRRKKKEKKGEPHVVKDKNGNGHTYERTYCCNTLITAAYAHGAKDSVIYKICNAGKCCGMAPKDWLKSSGFKKVGTCKTVKFDSLKPGDVILSDADKGAKYHHVWMYIGGGRYVEANGNNWSAESIAVKSGAKAYYNKFYTKYNGTNVMRYTK